jgi:two-component system sensor histidine kinase AtoS
MTLPIESLYVLLVLLFVLVLSIFVVFLKALHSKTLNVEGNRVSLEDTGLKPLNLFAKEIKSLRVQLALQERLATLGEVSAGIAHELRNPMAVIAGNTKLLLKSSEDPQQRELLEGIIREVTEINNIIEELLKFAHYSQLNKREINIYRLISEIVESLPEGNRVTYDGDREALLEADEQLLKQALKNLINNAFEAGASMVDIKLDRSFSKGVEWLNIKVSDNGKGMAEQEMEKVFQPFYSTKGSGVGIGLPLVQKIALEHGGSIKVESKLGQGSTFTLSLPMKV